MKRIKKIKETKLETETLTPKPEQKCFIYLGMHRTGSSLIAKGLNSVIDMGIEDLNKNEGNPEGYYENWVFTKINDMVLIAAGGSWDNPPSDEAIMEVGKSQDVQVAMRTAVEKYSDGRILWGFKDPRTTLTIKLWLPHIKNPHFVCCTREPEKVAWSLNKRDGTPFDKCLSLCQIYNRRMVKFLVEQYL